MNIYRQIVYHRLEPIVRAHQRRRVVEVKRRSGLTRHRRSVNQSQPWPDVAQTHLTSPIRLYQSTEVHAVSIRPSMYSETFHQPRRRSPLVAESTFRLAAHQSCHWPTVLSQSTSRAPSQGTARRLPRSGSVPNTIPDKVDLSSRSHRYLPSFSQDIPQRKPSLQKSFVESAHEATIVLSFRISHTPSRSWVIPRALQRFSHAYLTHDVHSASRVTSRGGFSPVHHHSGTLLYNSPSRKFPTLGLFPFSNPPFPTV